MFNEAIGFELHRAWLEVLMQLLGRGQGHHGWREKMRWQLGGAFLYSRLAINYGWAAAQQDVGWDLMTACGKSGACSCTLASIASKGKCMKNRCATLVKLSAVQCLHDIRRTLPSFDTNANVVSCTPFPLT